MKPVFLTLEVVSPQATALGHRATHTFNFKGGRFGRHSDNEWQIPDPNLELSRHQGRITFSNGLFYVENRSAVVPICINSEEFKVTLEQPYPLHDGDKLLVGDYVLQARLTDEPPPSAQPSPRADNADVDLQETLAIDGLDAIHEALFGNRPAPSVTAAEPLPDDRQGKSAHMRPKAKNPLDLFPSSPRGEEPQPHPIPAASILDEPAPMRPSQRRDEPSPGDAIDAVLGLYREREERAVQPGPLDAVGVADVLRGAGIDAARVSPETVRVLGEVLHAVVGGVRELLAARAGIKTQFRLAGTVYNARENNPLKAPGSIEETLELLLAHSGDAYMPPLRAFEEAFDDIRHHEMAMLAGIQAGYEHLLERFDPQRIKKRADKEATGPRLPLGAGARYWDFYSAYFTRETEDAADAFRHLFGDAFARAYEEKLQELKSNARTHRKGQ
jgi:type VI secretion system FHA domain protein